MLQGYSHFYVDIIARTTTGGILCYIFLVEDEDKSFAFKFDKDSGVVMIDHFNTDSKSPFKFELSVAEQFPFVNFAENY